ncbi:MAG TPA: GNAT family N-acetyltransferase, partial [Novosphingobium sp.]|nr:GNAT family N-acetyltransferase [Novosphingobium sp.]
MTSATRLRDAAPADAAALARLGREAFTAKFGHLYNPADLSAFLADAYAQSTLARALADPQVRYRVAERAGDLIALCRLDLRCGWPEHARGTCVVELKQLYTAPGLTGGGLGSALMDWAVATALGHGADEMQLSVWSENHGAQRFYARFGFAKVADTHFMVGGHRDEEFL